MLTVFRLWKLAFSRQNSSMTGRIRTFVTLMRIHAQAKLHSGKESLIQLQLDGYTVVGYSYVTLTELYTDIFIKQVYRFETSAPRPFIIDCGANIGMSVLYFKQLYPDSEIWAYEANPEAFALLQRNVVSNQLKGVRLFNYVLANTDGELDFYIPKATAGLNGSLHSSIAKGDKQRMQAYKLSTLLPKGRSVDFVKIDIEGAEFDVLADLSEGGLLDLVKQSVIELHASSEDMQQKYNRLLSYFGTAYTHKSMSDQYTLGYPHVVKFNREPSTSNNSK